MSSSPGHHRRAVSVSESGGESAQYAYDPGGNLVAVRSGTSALSVSGFNPAEGCPGQLVTLYGTGFAPVASQNTARVGGALAPVQWATQTSIGFLIPQGATSGRVSIAREGDSVTSAETLTVITALTISGFEPRMGRPGTTITIRGHNFDPSASGNAVAVGNGTATVTSANVASLLARVGSQSSGKVKVTAGGATATSAADFFLLPGDFTTSDVAYAGRADAAAATPIAGADGRIHVLLFDGVQGQRVTVYTSGNTYASRTDVSIFRPDGATFYSGVVPPYAEVKLVPGPLPSTGTYTAVIRPGPGSAGSLAVRILPEATGTFALEGAPLSLSLAAGQNGRVTFEGRAGDLVSLGWPSFTVLPSGPVSLTILQPDGKILANKSTSQPATWKLPALPVSGVYTLTLVPSDSAATSMRLVGSRSLTGEIATDGTLARCELTLAGQYCRYVFQGVAGQRLTAQATAASTFASPVAIAVLQPSGATLSSANFSGGGSVKRDLGALL
ncbi:MAG TPA: IPT/TIG domain-containing protein [Anaeromyxobacter sp.]|nr:IPT/TIG domain-containing protein [Anaeromyxobacter sp.]